MAASRAAAASDQYHLGDDGLELGSNPNSQPPKSRSRSPSSRKSGKKSKRSQREADPLEAVGNLMYGAAAAAAQVADDATEGLVHLPDAAAAAVDDAAGQMVNNYLTETADQGFQSADEGEGVEEDEPEEEAAAENDAAR